MSGLPDERDQVGICSSPCFVCGRAFWFWPSKVVPIEIDPATGVPPDVDPQTGQALDPPRVADTVQRVICPPCVESINVERVERALRVFPVFDAVTIDAGT